MGVVAGRAAFGSAARVRNGSDTGWPRGRGDVPEPTGGDA
jgi:hypothetical protein